ncbi:hypothetical protein [Streptomyces hainanensis]|uniref:Uncharacterized protein n=1 Tax=Streptomyces hainanensis TaxID=402648 RepID=A0A4R4TJP6_9ACTN|nr:hypothetical protein [Streptomyces hainanensis]TDC76686.1 hypothetical protein E1283_09205 [Streptomyces hainanensis]
MHDFNAEEPALRRAMEQAVDGLAPRVDLVPRALTLGRRRRARIRLATAAGGLAFAAVTAALVVDYVPRGTDPLPAPPVASGPSVEETGAPVSTPEAADAAEPVEIHRARVMDALDRLLPARAGSLESMTDGWDTYIGVTENGGYRIGLDAVPASGRADGSCTDGGLDGLCRPYALDDGTPVAAWTESESGVDVSVRVRFQERDLVAEIVVDAATNPGMPLPLSAEDLVALANDEEVRDLIVEGAGLAEESGS